MKKGDYIIFITMAFTACWLGGCSADSDSSEPANTGQAIVFAGLDLQRPVNDVTLLMFDHSLNLIDIVAGGATLLDGTSLRGDLPEGCNVCFAAFDIQDNYTMLPENPVPGKTKASDISFELTGNTRTVGDNGAATPLCGSGSRGDHGTRVELAPMQGATVSVSSWVVRYVDAVLN